MNPAQARGMLRAQINQLAHLHALQYELQVKTSLLAQVQTALAKVRVTFETA